LLASLVIILPLLNVVFRSFLKEKFHLTGADFGYLFAFPGLGAMVGALYFTLAALKNPMRNLIVGLPCTVIVLVLIRYAPSAPIAAVMLGICGFFQYLNVASITQGMHLTTPDSMRGRLGSLITLGFGSISPLMSFPVGVYTDFQGFNAAILHLTLIFAGVSLYLAYTNFLAKPPQLEAK
jgi:sugar phosphate permease